MHLWLLLASSLCVNWFLPDPFMDERFHVAQTIRYASGDFTWDPMITTPPGLYAFGVVMLKMFPTLKPVVVLRSVSLLHAIVLDKVLMPGSWMVPIVFPYCLLYYTDIPALTWLLLARAFLQKRRIWLALLAGFAAVSMRQTNIVWLLYFQTCYSTIWQPLSLLYGAFAGFVWWNGGVALGDRTSHVACFHPAQLLYWMTMMGLLRSNLHKRTGLVWAIPIAFLALRYGHYAHPYLTIGDPHHLTSWWWTRMHPSSGWWTPVYAMAMIQAQDLMHLLPPLMLTAGLSPLVEPRYFIVPTVIALNSGEGKQKYMLLNGILLYLLVRHHVIY